MRKLQLFLMLLITLTGFSQVGIGTTNPTNTLDVNGGARVRNLSEGTVQSDTQGNLNVSPYKVYAFVVVSVTNNNNNGNNSIPTILKQYGVSSVTYQGGGKFRIVFTNPMVDNDYIILSMGKNRTLSYDGVSTGYVDVTVSSNNGSYDFNVMIIDII